MTSRVIPLALCGAALCAAAGAHAQVTLKPDGEWRSLFTAGANYSSGNNNSTLVNILGEGVRMTDHDKISLRGQLNYGKANGVRTAQRYQIGGQYNRDISRNSFWFGSADALRDRPTNIAHRWSAAGGVGRHMLRDNVDNTFDISVGLGYTQDSYVTPAFVIGQTRQEYGRTELVLSEESSHKLTETTKLRQKFTLLPNLTDRGAYRAVFDSGVSVAMTKALALTVGLNYRYDSDPGLGLKKGDLALVTGVSLRFD